MNRPYGSRPTTSKVHSADESVDASSVISDHVPIAPPTWSSFASPSRLPETSTPRLCRRTPGTISSSSSSAFTETDTPPKLAATVRQARAIRPRSPGWHALRDPSRLGSQLAYTSRQGDGELGAVLLGHPGCVATMRDRGVFVSEPSTSARMRAAQGFAMRMGHTRSRAAKAVPVAERGLPSSRASTLSLARSMASTRFSLT